jgi:hypothetical protein
VKYNKGQINIEFKNKIEDHFKYQWSNDRLVSFREVDDLRFFDELDRDQKVEIFKEFLFREFVISFKKFFTIPKNLKRSHSYFKWTDPFYQNFMIAFLRSLVPRNYKENEVIFEEL